MSTYRPSEWEPYRPGSGTEGMMFMEHWCERCARDNYSDDKPAGPNNGCRILARTLIYNISEPGYPKEWIRRKNDEDWPGSARCTAFVPREERSKRARRAWETRRANARAAFSGELFTWD